MPRRRRRVYGTAVREFARRIVRQHKVAAVSAKATINVSSFNSVCEGVSGVDSARRSLSTTYVESA